MGNETFLYLLSGAHAFIARVDPRSRARVGNSVRLTANLDRLHFFDPQTQQTVR